MRSLAHACLVFLLVGLAPSSLLGQQAKLTLKKGDRVCFIGETLAEREALFGTWEAMLHARFPAHKLVVRNLAFSGDTPAWINEDFRKGESRIRALNFKGIPHYLAQEKADVIFLCFGMNDSFAEDSLAPFAKEMQELIDHCAKAKFNGTSAPRLVVVGPIAHERLGGSFRDVGEHNRQLLAVTDTLRKIAVANKLPFVDLFRPTLALAREASGGGGGALTFNGIHPNAYGHWAVGHFLVEALFGRPRPIIYEMRADDVDFSEEAQKTRYLVPPPPPGSRVHPSLLARLPRLVASSIPLGSDYAVVIDEVPWQSFAGRQLRGGATLEASPWQEAGEMIRLAAVDRNTEFFRLWRAVNGEYIYGRRAKPFGVVNFPGEKETLRKIVEQLDVAVHQATKLPEVRYAGIGPVKVRVPPRKMTRPEPDPTSVAKVYHQQQGVIGGTEFPTAKDPAEALKHFKLPEGYEINLWASEKDFPLHDPLAMAWDARGRLWVTTMPSYPHALPGVPPDDKILILEDTKKAGKADKFTVFADKLYLPTGIALGQGGAYVGTQPNVTFLRDTDGDGKADSREVILHGFGTGDSHHAVHAFTWTPEGSLLIHEGIFHRANVETPYGVVRNRDAGIYRFQPSNHRLDVFVGYGFANPWGHVFDRWGQNYIADASGGSNYYGLPLTSKVEYPEHLPNMKVFTSVVRPTCGCEIVSSRHFPPEAQGNFLVTNNIGFQGIKQHRVIHEGSGVTSKELEPLLFSTDKNFRPVGISFGPDGALYIVDWYNPLIGHMQFSLRDPNRDHYHGRIWRITYKGRPLVKAPLIKGQPIAKLLELLREYEDRTRERVRNELRDRDRFEVKKALDAWILRLDENDPEHERLLLEALWVYQGHQFVEEKLLERLLNAKDHRARAAATRALRNYRERVPPGQALAYYQAQINDVHPQVRLEAVVALSHVGYPWAVDIVQEAFDHPTDYYLDYSLKNTMKALEPFWKKSLQDGKLVVKNTGAANFFLGSVGTQDLVKLPRSTPVFLSFLSRAGIPPTLRVEAIEGLAKVHKTDVLTEILAAIERGDRAEHGVSDHVLHDLAHLLTMQPQAALAKIKPRLEQLARGGRSPLARQVAYVALMTADRALDPTWTEAVRSPVSLVDVVEALPLVPDVNVRTAAFDRVHALLSDLPAPLKAQAQSAAGTQARFLRIDLPGKKRTLTLAEVEVFSGAKNIAPGGKAKQSSTAHGGDAGRAIDGNRAPTFKDGGQTHTAEDSKDPWWELDLGQDTSITAIAIHNRGEKFASRLEGYTLTLLDAHRKPVFVKANNPAPNLTARFAFESNPAELIRAAAIDALVSIPGKEAEVFASLASLITKGIERDRSVRAMQKIPKAKWPKQAILPLAQTLLTHVRQLPAKDRGELHNLDAIQLGSDLATLLGAEAAPLASEFGKLSVPVVRIGTIPHNTVFDVAEFSVEAGKPLVLVLENNDIMPHNLVIGVPGSLSELGQLAEKMAQDPGAFARHFVPSSPKVLHATRLLQPKEQDRINFVAPKTPGKYVFVCTFPGHWPIMNGIMHVVPDLSKVAAVDRVKPLEDKKWTLAELSDILPHVESGRSFERGRELFKLRTCSQCHVMGGEGGKVGPELTLLPKKFAAKQLTMEGLLTEILEPSKVIDPKFRVHRFILDSGRTIDGMILEERPDAYVIVKNQAEPPVVIVKDSVELKTELKLSLMPEGLLSRMNREDIADLLAYLRAGGDARHAAFQRKE